MLLQILKSKIKHLTVTESNSEYQGSISLPEELMHAANIKPFESVHVNNKTNGNRIITYAIKSKQKGMVTINGAASKLFSQGDIVHVLVFAYMNDHEANGFVPTLVITDKENNLIKSEAYKLD